MRTDILGVGFDSLSTQDAILRAFDMIKRGSKAYVVTPNPEIVWLCRRNEPLREAVNGAGLVLPDGIGIIMAARILGTPLRSGRVTGIDFASGLFSMLAEVGGSVFLLGAKPGVAPEAGNRLAAAFPGLKVAGALDGYFSDDGPVIEQINSAKPDLLLVCLGFPKQEFWMAENLELLNVPLFAGLGGSLDVFAGCAKRAPAFFRKIGMEWFYRLVTQPWRIKRMLKLPLFILMVIWKRISTRVKH